jgi:hypothetical protein
MTHPDQSTTILNNVMVVFQQVTNLGSIICELPVAGSIMIEIVQILKERLNN